MKLIKTSRLLLILLLLAGFCLAGPDLVRANDDTTIKIGLPAQIEAGEEFAAAVNISQVKDFNAANYDIKFDSTVLSLQKIEDGQIGEQIIGISMWREIEPGRVRVIHDLAGVSGASGSGSLAKITFKCLRETSTTISFENGVLSNIYAQEIAVTWIAEPIQFKEDGKNSNIITPPVTSTGGGGSSQPAEKPAPKPPQSETTPSQSLNPITKNVIVLSINKLEASRDGKSFVLDAKPFIKPGVNRTLVPVRFISEGLGAKVEWLANSRQVKITDKDVTILLTIGSKTVLVNGRQTELDCPAEIVKARTFAPVRFISETLGAAVNWDKSGVITIER